MNETIHHHASLMDSYRALSTEHKIQTDIFLLLGVALLMAIFLGGGDGGDDNNKRPPTGLT